MAITAQRILAIVERVDEFLLQPGSSQLWSIEEAYAPDIGRVDLG